MNELRYHREDSLPHAPFVLVMVEASDEGRCLICWALPTQVAKDTCDHSYRSCCYRICRSPQALSDEHISFFLYQVC